MNDKNISINLDCDDVVLIEEDITKVNKLKEMIIIEAREELKSSIVNIQKFITQHSEPPSEYGQSNLNLEFQVVSCQLLQVNGKGWHKGKLNIKICISLMNSRDDKVYLKFFPEQPITPESPLNDVREMIQSN